MSSENKTPIEDLRRNALNHYEEASAAIHHHNSFVVEAIKNYDPDLNKRLEELKALKDKSEILVLAELGEMLKCDPYLYYKILDTAGFAYHFNNICNIARQRFELLNPKQQ